MEGGKKTSIDFKNYIFLIITSSFVWLLSVIFFYYAITNI